MICQAIVTKYFGPTNTRGSKIKASASAGSKTVEWNHSLGVDENHRDAAYALAAKLGWEGQWFGGGMPGGNSNVYVCAVKDRETNRLHAEFVIEAVQS